MSVLVTTESSTGAVSETTPDVPIVGALLTCNAVVYDQQHFLDLFDRLFPYDYLAPMKLSANSGYELLQAFAAVGARISESVEHLECGALVIFSTGGTYSLVPVIFTRPAPGTPAVTEKAGTVVRTTTQGRDFLTVDDLAMPATGDFTVNAQAQAVGYQWNVRGERTAANGELLEGEIQQVILFRQDPAYGDPNVTVNQVADATGGKSADLDGLASNRNLLRVIAETDDEFRLRIRSLPDVVSPDAIYRLVYGRLNPVGIPFDIIEVFEHRYQEEYDAPSPNIGTPTYQAIPPTNPDYDNRTFCYDDPRDPDPFRNRWLDEVEYRGAFFVVVPNDFTLFDVGFAYDDPEMFASDFRDVVTGKQRGTPAYDGSSTDPPALVYPAAYDGYDTARAALYAGLFQDLQKVKPIGVAAIMVAPVP